jgi:predicted nuclease of predicted toxin-antitoxin system
VRFLIDECLSVALVAVAANAGHEARHIGRAGSKDRDIVHYAAAEDFVVVTNNASDFRRLVAAQTLHAGLIILVPNVGRAMQCRLFQAALDQLVVFGEPVNQVLEVDLAGDDVTFALYDLPGEMPRGTR